MMLETGGPDVNFAPKALAGVPTGALLPPEQLLLDGQQRLTSLYQSLKSKRPVSTMDARGKKLERWYMLDIQRSLGDDGDREEAVLSVPSDLKLRDNFGRIEIADYSTVEKQCDAGMFPLWLAYDMPAVFGWAGQFTGGDQQRIQAWNDFYTRVLNNIITYTVPVIILKRATPKEAVCTVFEKVNTGGVPLNVFELLTATFAGNKAHQDFRLNDDWRERLARLQRKRVLRSIESTDFLQAITLLATRARQVSYLEAGGDPAQAPGVGCKRRDILRLTLDDYLAFAPKVEEALLWAAGFLGQEHIFRSEDVPYRSQLVPLAAIRAVLGQKVETHAADARLRRYYWSGVLGELYGGSTETRFARDLEQVVPWVMGGPSEPGTVSESNFQSSRLLTLKTRNSAAYKGIYALLMRSGGQDWIYNKQMSQATFLDLAVDIHHIFPKAWCEKNGIDAHHRESIVNKTALSAATNRAIGGRSPQLYIKTVETKSGISGHKLDGIIRSHLIDPAALRTADFKAFFDTRRAELLALITTAMGKQTLANDDGPGSYEAEDEGTEPEDDDLAFEPTDPGIQLVSSTDVFGS